MARKYQHTLELLPQIKEMLESGMSQKEVEKQLGLSGSRPIHYLLVRERGKELQGVPKPRGRKPAKTLQEYRYENKRLKMELYLFLQQSAYPNKNKTDTSGDEVPVCCLELTIPSQGAFCAVRTKRFSPVFVGGVLCNALLYVLLLAPDFHYEVNGQMFYKLNLTAHGRTENRYGLALFKVLHRLLGYLFGSVPSVNVFNVLVVMCGGLELGFYPAGAYTHNADASRLKLLADGTGQTEHIALACAVNCLIGNGLPRGVRAHIYNVAAAFHVRKAYVAHGGKCNGVEIYAVEQL